VRNAVQLLGEIGDRSVRADVTLALEHRDLRVRRAAENALIAMETVG
jgi:HEAT repeat protein